MEPLDGPKLAELRVQLNRWAEDAGFDALYVTDTDLTAHRQRYLEWLDAGHHGSMGYLANNIEKRLQPNQLVEQASRAIVVRMNYLPEGRADASELDALDQAVVSRYATGRDYHKVLRRRLARIATKLDQAVQPYHHSYRAFTDSAPVLEKALAVKAGHGWVGRHSLVLNAEAGSWFFLGEILTNVPLEVDPPDDEDRCGNCRACLNVCPTDAILDDRTIDARRCIAYLTIENKAAIPVELRRPMGNRVFGCDDCQLFCPWNREAQTTREPDFTPRGQIAKTTLAAAMAWDEAEFLKRTEGTALRRLDHEQWQRNVAVALGNASASRANLEVLNQQLERATPMVAEHIRWALNQLAEKNAER